MTKKSRVVVREVQTELGATMVEYALIVGVIAIAVVVGGEFFGLRVLALFESISNAF